MAFFKRELGPVERFESALKDKLAARLFGPGEDGALPLVEEARGGTLCLEDIEAMPGALQARLLTFINDQGVPPETRIIAICNSHAPDTTLEQALRPDLFYRLGAMTILLPPLRTRGEDILQLFTRLSEQFAEELTGRLSENPAYHFQIFANRWEAGGHPFTFHRIPIISFPKFMTTISFARFVHRRLRRADFSLIHTHDRIFAADIYTLHGVPHRYWVNHVRRKRMSLFDHATAWVEKELVYQGGCKKFIAVSKLTKEIFLGQYAVDTKRVEVIHPGVNLSRYENKDKNRIRHGVRQKWQIGNDDFAVIFASMNFEIKGLDHIIHSLAKLRAQGKKVKLIVAGKGNVKKYQKIARKAQMADNIVFTGVLPADQLVNLYLSGDIYICLLYTSPSPRDRTSSRMPSSA